ncbi:hypothetical protein [Bradyrhizobium sp. USDA 3364]
MMEKLPFARERINSLRARRGEPAFGCGERRQFIVAKQQRIVDAFVERPMRTNLSSNGAKILMRAVRHADILK